MPSSPRVRQAIAEFTDALSRPHDMANALAELTRSACETIPGIDYASINVLHLDGRLETIAQTDAIAVKLDELQAELEEGPCYDAAIDGEVATSENLRHDPRWPSYGPRAADLGVGAQIGLDLPTAGKGRATLNLYATAPGSFGEAPNLAEVFAASAALAMGFTRTMNTLTFALRTRTEIGKAIGIVMERYELDEDRAFQFLVRVSQDSNTKLRDVASDIVERLESRR